MKTNTKTVTPPVFTHEGGRAAHITAEQELRRSVMACLLWESEFYESGVTIAERIKTLIGKVNPASVAAIAREARSAMKLRHVPLLIAREMARSPAHRSLAAATLYDVIQRADELAEFLAIYWKEGKQPLSAQVKRGLAAAFAKFDEYALAKYNRDADVKLRDVLFLCHAKPSDKAQEKLWQRLISGELKTPDTWEVALSGGADKATTFTRLMAEGQLGALALLRNLRNMVDSGVELDAIRQALKAMKTDRVLPFRFISAARYAPALEPELEAAMIRSVATQDRLPGETVLLVDVSGSMDVPLSSKSELRRADAASGLAILLREVCEHCQVFTFSSALVQVPARRGFALRDAITRSQSHASTYLGAALTTLRLHSKAPDRLIVITDEQAQDEVGNPQCQGYLINVASAQNGVGYGKWTHIDGWSEAVVGYIQTLEKSGLNR